MGAPRDHLLAVYHAIALGEGGLTCGGRTIGIAKILGIGLEIDRGDADQRYQTQKM